MFNYDKRFFSIIASNYGFNRDLFEKVFRLSNILELMVLTTSEEQFLRRFRVNVYVPQLLFEDLVIIERIQSHPMALWKTRNLIRV